MKKLLLLAAFAGSITIGNAQTTLFSDDFESYQDFAIAFGQYKMLDVDKLTTYIGGITTQQGVLPWPNAYAAMVCQVFNPSVAGVQNGHGGERTNFDPHGGKKYLAFWAGNPKGSTTRNNDWFILPGLTLGTGNKINYWVKSLSDDYGLEEYKISIYQGETAPTAYTQFTDITPVRKAVAEWDYISIDIPATYDNKKVFLAINYRSSDTYMLMLDDLSVTTASVLGLDAVSKDNFAVYPNPSGDGVFNIKTDKKIASYETYSADGRKIKEEKATSAADLKAAPRGVYILKVNFADGTSATKQVIKK